MNWSAVSFDWNQVRAFLATAEEGSLSAAARVLGQTQPTLGRQVAALEACLQVDLFERQSRGLVLTPAGRSLLRHVRDMAAAATRLSLAAEGFSTAVDGTVRVTATEMYSALVLPPIVAQLQAAHPGIHVEVIATNSLSNLKLREADIALRNTDPSEPDLIARKIREDEGGFFASRDLLKRTGPIDRVEDLAHVPMIGFGNPDEYVTGMNARGVPVSPDNIVAWSDSHLVQWELAKSGVGIGLNAGSLGEHTPNMVRILPELASWRFPLWLVAPHELKTSPRIRLVFDWLAEALRPKRHENTSR